MRRPRNINSGLRPAPPKPEVVVKNMGTKVYPDKFCDECVRMVPVRKSSWSRTGWICNLCQSDARTLEADESVPTVRPCGNCGGDGFEEIQVTYVAGPPRYVTATCRTCNGSGYR